MAIVKCITTTATRKSDDTESILLTVSEFLVSTQKYEITTQIQNASFTLLLIFLVTLVMSSIFPITPLTRSECSVIG